MSLTTLWIGLAAVLALGILWYWVVREGPRAQRREHFRTGVELHMYKESLPRAFRGLSGDNDQVGAANILMLVFLREHGNEVSLKRARELEELALQVAGIESSDHRPIDALREADLVSPQRSSEFESRVLWEETSAPSFEELTTYQLIPFGQKLADALKEVGGWFHEGAAGVFDLLEKGK